MKGCSEQSIRIYLKQAAKYKVLTREEEAKLISEYRNGSVKAYHELVAANGRFIYSIALKYRSTGVPLADLIQEGNLGLIDALARYKPESECRLLTLAVWYIKEYIRQCVLSHFSIVRNGGNDLRIQLFSRDKSQQKKALRADHSLNVPVGDSEKTYIDLLESETNHPEALFGNEEYKSDLRDTVAAALAELNEAEQMVIRERLMAEDEKTLQEVGEQRKVTRERIRQIEAKASRKLKAILSRDMLLDLVA